MRRMVGGRSRGMPGSCWNAEPSAGGALGRSAVLLSLDDTQWKLAPLAPLHHLSGGPPPLQRQGRNHPLFSANSIWTSGWSAGS